MLWQRLLLIGKLFLRIKKHIFFLGHLQLVGSALKETMFIFILKFYHGCVCRRVSNKKQSPISFFSYSHPQSPGTIFFWHFCFHSSVGYLPNTISLYLHFLIFQLETMSVHFLRKIGFISLYVIFPPYPPPRVWQFYHYSEFFHPLCCNF